jgi:deoxyribodipyrimidine photolyase
MRTIVWSRDCDLRPADHEALSTALAAGGSVIPVFEQEDGVLGADATRRSPHRTRHLSGALGALSDAIEARGSHLVVLGGPPETLLAPGSVRMADGGTDTVFSHFARVWGGDGGTCTRPGAVSRSGGGSPATAPAVRSAHA